jgi:hypothetical protein
MTHILMFLVSVYGDPKWLFYSLKRLITNTEYIKTISLGLMSRLSTLFKAKTNTVLGRFEKPEKMLDYSFEKQTELLNKLRRDIAEVVS